MAALSSFLYSMYCDFSVHFLLLVSMMTSLWSERYGHSIGAM